MSSVQIALYITNHSCTYWSVAGILSIFWGIFGVMYERLNEYQEVKIIRNITLTKTKIENIKRPCWYMFGTFLSDGMLSLVGWISLYLLLVNIGDNKLHEYENFNIFLGTLTVICITGYGYKIAEKLKS